MLSVKGFSAKGADFFDEQTVFKMISRMLGSRHQAEPLDIIFVRIESAVGIAVIMMNFVAFGRSAVMECPDLNVQSPVFAVLLGEVPVGGRIFVVGDAVEFLSALVEDEDAPVAGIAGLGAGLVGADVRMDHFDCLLLILTTEAAL